VAAVGTTTRPPRWIKPQLTRLVDEAPVGKEWVHEIKYDGYRVHARIDDGDIKLLTRTGLDWSRRYRRTIEALGELKVKSAYLDGELCALNADGVPVFSRLQGRHGRRQNRTARVLCFDLLFLNGAASPSCRWSIARRACNGCLGKRFPGGCRWQSHRRATAASARHCSPAKCTG